MMVHPSLISTFSGWPHVEVRWRRRRSCRNRHEAQQTLTLLLLLLLRWWQMRTRKRCARRERKHRGEKKNTDAWKGRRCRSSTLRLPLEVTALVCRAMRKGRHPVVTGTPVSDGLVWCGIELQPGPLAECLGGCAAVQSLAPSPSSRASVCTEGRGDDGGAARQDLHVTDVVSPHAQKQELSNHTSTKLSKNKVDAFKTLRVCPGWRHSAADRLTYCALRTAALMVFQITDRAVMLVKQRIQTQEGQQK